MALKFRAKMAVWDFLNEATTMQKRSFQIAIEEEQKADAARLTHNHSLTDANFVQFVRNIVAEDVNKLIAFLDNALRTDYGGDLARFLLTFFP